MKNVLIAGLLAVVAAPIPVSVAQAQPYSGHDDDRGYRGGRDDRGPDRDGQGYRGSDRGGPDHRWGGDRQDWDASRAYRDDRRYRGHERRLGRDDRVYHGRDGRYYCRRNDGTTGLVVGGLGGGLAGGLIGGDTLGALVGAGAGALLGRSVDRGNVRCR